MLEKLSAFSVTNITDDMLAKFIGAALLFLSYSFGAHGILNGEEKTALEFKILASGVVHTGAKEGHGFVVCTGVLISYRYRRALLNITPIPWVYL